MAEKEAGKVIHYFGKAGVAVVRLTGKLSEGDMIRVAKGDDDFAMKIASMQVDHEPVKSGKKGDEVAIKVDEATKEGAEVFKVTE